MKKQFYLILLILSSFFFTNVCFGHFGMLIPSDSMIMQNDNRSVHLQLSFSHPFENIGMELEKPKQFNLIAHGKKINLQPLLKPAVVMGHQAWQYDYRIKRPGVYVFYMEPVPYWEPAEDCFIIHYTKTIVASFGDDEGWDNEMGLEAEIVPLSKPFGLYTHNIFQGIVKFNGQPVSFTEVEVEYYNEHGKAIAPTEYMITQTIKTDSNGVFSYAVPKSGWWGFAALKTADYQIKYKNKNRDVELGAVIWVEFLDWQEK